MGGATAQGRGWSQGLGPELRGGAKGQGWGRAKAQGLGLWGGAKAQGRGQPHLAEGHLLLADGAAVAQEAEGGGQVCADPDRLLHLGQAEAASRHGHEQQDGPGPVQLGSWLGRIRTGLSCRSGGRSLLSRPGCPRVSAGPRGQRQSSQSPAETFWSWRTQSSCNHLHLSQFHQDCPGPSPEEDEGVPDGPLEDEGGGGGPKSIPIRSSV